MTKPPSKRRRRDQSRMVAQALSLAMFTFSGVILGMVGGTEFTPSIIEPCVRDFT
jgi:hypothetical protein